MSYKSVCLSWLRALRCRQLNYTYETYFILMAVMSAMSPLIGRYLMQSIGPVIRPHQFNKYTFNVNKSQNPGPIYKTKIPFNAPEQTERSANSWYPTNILLLLLFLFRLYSFDGNNWCKYGQKYYVAIIYERLIRNGMW